MPYTFKFELPPAGYSLSSAKPGEEVTVQHREFTSTEDGQHFIQRLEGLPNDILANSKPRILPSHVDHLLAVIQSDGSATAYVNELILSQQVRVNRPMEAGEIVMREDIVDVEQLDLGIDIPDTAGFVFVFSAGWRKGLFYDLSPINPKLQAPRTFDIADTLGQALCYLLFQERFSITEKEWEIFFAHQWFPFAGLSSESVDALLNCIRSGWNLDDKIPDIDAELRTRINDMLNNWNHHPSFAPHIEVLRRAVERYENEDFLSCTALLFTRIEGILRTHHTSLETTMRPSAKNLSKNAVNSRVQKDICLLMPHRFAEYLENIYFANFNPTMQEIGVSRHSVAHGVATATEFNRKSSIIGLLVVHQLFYFLCSN